MKKLCALAVCLACISACGATGVSLKQNATLSLQVSNTALLAAQGIERSLCFNVPATESGAICTNPVAASVGLTAMVTDPNDSTRQVTKHQAIAVYFIKAFNDVALAGQALLLWGPGNTPPASVAAYQFDILAILAAAHTLLPGTVTQPLVDNIQVAVNAGAAIALAVGVK